jgi:hypothetical protein
MQKKLSAVSLLSQITSALRVSEKVVERERRGTWFSEWLMADGFFTPP